MDLSFLDRHAFRRSGLIQVRKALRAGWPIAPEDRERIRARLAELTAAGELDDRESKLAAEVLARLGEGEAEG